MNKLYIILIIVIPIILLAQSPRWIYHYDAGTPGSGYDEAFSLVYGQDGNIYAAGRSFDASAGYEDFTIISLTAVGTQRWVYRYNATNNTDWARAIVYGLDGNIYAAGKSNTYTTDDDIVVISLTSSGAQRWVYRYNGPVNNIDDAYAIVYGTDGNIYIAGTSMSSSTNYDFVVISLTTTGSERWVYRYDGPGNSEDQANSLVYGLDGNIYAAGYSFNNVNTIDFTVISLTPSGTQRWVFLYNGSGNGWDKAFSIVCGADSNLYASGFSSDISTYRDFSVISLNRSGVQRWVYRCNVTPNFDEEARSVTYGADGNIYVAGFLSGLGTMADFAVVSLTNTGTQRWFYRYNGSANYNDEARSIAYGTDGNIYAAGFIYAETGTNTDFTAIRLTSTGTQRWVYTYNGPGASPDLAHAVVFGADGNVYVAGACDSNAYENTDFLVVSLNAGTGIEENYITNHLAQSIFRITANTFQNRNLIYSLSTPEPTHVEFSLYNIYGEKINYWRVLASKGTSYYVQNLSRLSQGIYFLQAKSANNAQEHLKVIITGE